MNRLILLGGMLLLGQIAMSQTYEEWLKKEKDEQNKLAKEQTEKMRSLQKEYDDFVEKRDKEFADFLKKGWIEYDVLEGKKVKEEPKPRDIPMVTQKLPQGGTPLKVKADGLMTDKQTLSPVSRIKKSIEPDYLTQEINVNFYGNRIALFPDKKLCKSFTGVLNETGFSDYWLQASETNYDDLLDMLWESKQRLGLNDWGYYMFVKACAELMVENENSVEMLTWFLLNKSGYIARLGFDKNSVSLLLPALQQIYKTSYVVSNGVHFYIMRPIDELQTYESDFAGSSRYMDLRFPTALNFAMEKPKTRTIEFKGQSLAFAYNPNVTTFYDDYPSTELKVCFNAPLSATAKESISESLFPLLKDVKPNEQVKVLLSLLHESFPYKTDEDQFGQEKYFFPEEILAFPYSDCEDRAAFFSSLVKNMVGLSGIGLSYPGHVSTAIRLSTEGENEECPGDYIVWQGERYMACDPTYMGAVIGQSMPEFQKLSAEIIPLSDDGLSAEREDIIVKLIADAGGMVINPDAHIAADGSGNVYVTGVFDSCFIGGQQPVFTENKTLFLAKVDANNRLSWVNTFVSKESNMPQRLKLESDKLFLAGLFHKKGAFGGYTITSDGNTDLFLSCIRRDGKIEWAVGGGLQEKDEQQSYHYTLRVNMSGKIAKREMVLDVIGMPEMGIFITPNNELVVTGRLEKDYGVRTMNIAGKQSAATADVSEQLKEMNDLQIKQQTDKSMAGLLAVINLIHTNSQFVSGEVAVKTLDKYNPTFKKRCPNIYKSISRVGFIRNDDGIIRLKTSDGKPVNFDKVRVKDGSRMRMVVLPDKKVQVDIIDGIEVGKAIVWFKLNKVVLYAQNGDMVFDYDKDHTLKTFNLGRDILN